MTLFVPAYAPSYGASVKKSYRTLNNTFGDGYEQSVADGLNNVVETWELAWNALNETNANDIEDQLTAFAGTTFEWETPKGVTKKFTCKEMSKVYTGFQSYNITATFIESFS